jgi:hypothetical protein
MKAIAIPGLPLPPICVATTNVDAAGPRQAQAVLPAATDTCSCGHDGGGSGGGSGDVPPTGCDVNAIGSLTTATGMPNATLVMASNVQPCPSWALPMWGSEK